MSYASWAVLTGRAGREMVVDGVVFLLYIAKHVSAEPAVKQERYAIYLLLHVQVDRYGCTFPMQIMDGEKERK